MSELAQPVATSNAAHPIVNPKALYAAGVQEQFKRHRIVVVPRSVSVDTCEAVLRSIKSSKLIIVDEPQAREVTRFYTINGDRLIAACPEVVEIERCLLEWINYISGDSYISLDNRAIGISLNVTPPGGGFGTHLDRNAVTIVLYLNDADGGALHIYPPFPVGLRMLRRYAIKWLNLSHGGIADALHRLFLRPVRVDPRVGTVAALTWMSHHRVDPVAPGSLRFSLVVAADRPGISFKEGQKYYGYGTSEISFSDIWLESLPVRQAERAVRVA
jgi:hypothetical protein